MSTAPDSDSSTTRVATGPPVLSDDEITRVFSPLQIVQSDLVGGGNFYPVCGTGGLPAGQDQVIIAVLPTGSFLMASQRELGSSEMVADALADYRSVSVGCSESSDLSELAEGLRGATGATIDSVEAFEHDDESGVVIVSTGANGKVLNLAFLGADTKLILVVTDGETEEAMLAAAQFADFVSS